MKRLLLSTMPIVFSGLLLAIPAQVFAAESMVEDRGHVYRWNRFTEDLYALHKQQLTEHDIRKEVKVNGYVRRDDFYREERYYDAESGKLLSVIQWETEHPDNIHSITVYRYDDQGRLSRDYASAYLPDYRNAPTQTLIFIHRYNEGLKAFRSFDASNDLLSERCEGEFEGEDVFISLDIDEIEEAMAQRYQHNTGILTEPVYQRCFEDMPESVEAYLPPR